MDTFYIWEPRYKTDMRNKIIEHKACGTINLQCNFDLLGIDIQ